MRSKSDDGGGLLLIGVALFFGARTVWYYVAEPVYYIWSAFVWVFLLTIPLFLAVQSVLFVQLLFSWRRRTAVAAANSSLAERVAQLEEIYDRGDRAGLYRTSRSNGHRFDERSNLGRDLNARLGNKEVQLRRSEDEAGSARLAWAVAASAPLVGLLYLLSYHYSHLYAGWLKTTYQWVQSNTLRLHTLEFDVSHIFLANLTSLVAIPLCIAGAKGWAGTIRPSPESQEKPEAEFTSRNRAKFGSSEGDDTNQGRAGERSGGRADEGEPVETWFDILGITPKATIEEIKAAYRRMIVQYHPDKTAHLGPKLKAMAESESQRIDAAYTAAVAARGGSCPGR